MTVGPLMVGDIPWLVCVDSFLLEALVHLGGVWVWGAIKWKK